MATASRSVSAPLLFAALAAAAPAAEQTIDPCSAPLQLTFHDFPTFAGRTLQASETLCAGRDASPMEVAGAWDDPPPDPATLPLLAVRRVDGHAELTLTTPAPQRRELGLTLPLDGEPRALAASDGAAAPPWRVSARIADVDLVALQVVDMPSDALLAELVRIEQLRVKQLRPIGAEPVSFHLSGIPVTSVLQMLADASGLRLRLERDGSYTIGTPRHAAEIEKLREDAHEQRMAADTDALRRTLEAIVALGAREDGGDIAEYVGDEHGELVELAFAADDDVRAERLARERLAYLERESGFATRAIRADALADLGRARWRQDDGAGAQPLLERALALYEQAADPSTSDERAAIAARLGSIALERGDVADGESHARRAYAWLDQPRDGYVDPLQRHLALAQGERVAMLLALKLAELERRADAQPHLEHALRYGMEAADGWGIASNVQLDLLMENARVLEQPRELARHARHELALAQTHGDDDGASKAHALGRLALAQVRLGESGAALATWLKLQELRRATLGERSIGFRDGEHARVLLLRRAGRPGEADNLQARLRTDLAPLTAGAGSLPPRLLAVLSFDLLDELERDLERALAGPGAAGRDAELQALLAAVHAARR